MPELILKDWYGKEQTFDKETIYIYGKDGELLPFTHGEKAVIEPLEVTKNGTYEVPEGVSGYSPVTVAVPAPEIKLQEKTIKENGEYTADSGFDGLLKVLVDVAASGSATIKKMSSNLYYDKGDRYTFNHKYGVVPDIAMFYQIGTLSGDGTIAAVAFKDLTYSSRYGYSIAKSGTTFYSSAYTSAAYTDNSTGSSGIYMSETQIILPKRPSVQGSCEYTFIWINPPET